MDLYNTRFSVSKSFRLSPLDWAVTAVLLSVALLFSSELARGREAPGSSQSAATFKSGLRAFPRVDLGAGRQLNYVGTYSADGRFKPMTKFGRFVENMKANSANGTQNQKIDPNIKPVVPDATSTEVPPEVSLRSYEHVVEQREVEKMKAQSTAGDLRDAIVSFAYGPEKLLKTPQSVTTDSRQRVIITDPAARAVHVLDSSGNDSFRILGGPGKRLRSPGGVAVDADDDLYVSDSERGTILVYDSQGKFLREIGEFRGESQFETPAGIAIDRKTGYIYLVDTSRHLVDILDLQGKVLARVGTTEGASSPGFGNRNGSLRPGEFQRPTIAVIHNNELIVLDNTRIQIFDLQGKFLNEISISTSTDRRSNAAPGLCVDMEGNFYVSDPGAGMVRVYRHDGRFLGSFGRIGENLGEFEAAAGMWADSSGRIYIADVINRRVQVFQLTGAKAN